MTEGLGEKVLCPEHGVEMRPIGDDWYRCPDCTARASRAMMNVTPREHTFEEIRAGKHRA